jgi:hypothetical protein
MTTLQKQLDNVSLSFRDNGLTVGSYIHHLTHSSEHTVTCQEAQKSLIDHAVSICSNLANYLPTRPSVISWTIKTAKQLFRKDVSELTQEQHGLHFHASKASSSYLEGSFMEESEEKMKKSAPLLWDLVYSLLDSDTARRRAMVELDGTPSEVEMDLGEFGGDNLDQMEVDSAPTAAPDVAKAKKKQERAGKRNAALLTIVRI